MGVGGQRSTSCVIATAIGVGLATLVGAGSADGQAAETVVVRVAGRSLAEAEHWPGCGVTVFAAVVHVQVVRSTTRELRRGTRLDVVIECPRFIPHDACVELELDPSDLDTLRRGEAPHERDWRPAPCRRPVRPDE